MYFIGDIHGAITTLASEIQRSNVTGQNFIQVGDFGIGFNNPESDEKLMTLVNHLFAERDNRLYVIRGNHDNPAWFDGSKKWSHIELLADYSVREIEGKKIVFIGGAISIDRKYRQEGKSYWPEEVFDLDEDKLEALRDIDMVVTHTCPAFAWPLGCDAPIVNSFAKKDPSLKSELISERHQLSLAYFYIKKHNNPKEWIYGHFHTPHTEVYEDCKFTLLNIGEFYFT